MLTIVKIQILLLNYFLKKLKKITSGAFSYTSNNNKAWVINLRIIIQLKYLVWV